MARLQPHSFGLAFGLFLACWHAIWAALVWIGAAQFLIDFIFQLHMISPAWKIAEFHLGTAAALVAVTGVIGYIGGWVFGYLWNRLGVSTQAGA
jgi:hypothetical protein